MLTSGLLVNDRYRLDAPIAAGGMGQVWRATDTVLGRVVAVKLLHRPVDDLTQARFRNEARAMAALQHPGVADVYDYGETDLPEGNRLAYIVMACVEGQPLSQRIAEAGRLTAPQTRSIVTQAARALQAVHDAGVVHRDVKPSNLIIEPDGTVVVIDFGVAVTADAPGQTTADEVVGTALYMAPEQVTKQPLTAATDMYALGAVAYHCLTGRPPFEGDNAIAVALRHLQDEPAPLLDEVPADLRHAIATAMAKDPGQRYPTAAAMADAIEAGATDATTMVVAAAALAPPSAAAPAPPSAAEPQRRVPRATNRLRAVGALLAGIAALLAVLAFADPTGILPLPGERPRPPAATTDVVAPSTTEPADDGSGGAGGQPQTANPTSGVVPAPAGPVSGGDAPQGTAPNGSPTPQATGEGEEPAEPEPTAPAEQPSSEPSTPDDSETEPADPEPTGPSGESSPQPAVSTAG